MMMMLTMTMMLKQYKFIPNFVSANYPVHFTAATSSEDFYQTPSTANCLHISMEQ